MNNNLTTETKFGYLQRQALVAKLAHRFAELNSYQIEQNSDTSDTQNSQIKTWVAMAEIAVSEVEREITLGFEGDSNEEQDADIAAFSDLDEDTVNELMDI
jgi:hypothetical protein